MTARAALAVALVALVCSATGLADAAGNAVSAAVSSRTTVKLSKNGKLSAAIIPTVARARNASKLGGRSATDLTLTCPANTVDLGTWCLLSGSYPVDPKDSGKNDYFFATQACVALGGYLPTAAQLIGAASRVKLASTITDNDSAAGIDEDATDGLKDKREMSATLVTTAAGSSAAGSEGVSTGSRGDPRAGEPDPTPQPANPAPDTLQYVTVYDNGDKGGFAGSQPVSAPQSFRCAFDKQQGAATNEIG